MSIIKKIGDRRYLTILSLTGAAFAAYGASNYLSWVGTAYYILCAAAILKNYPRVSFLLWAAVGAHAILTGYSLWNWQAMGVIPCSYCLAAAGFVLVAATTLYRLPLAILPVLLIVSVWFVWPGIFAGEHELNNDQINEVLTQSLESQPESAVKPSLTEENNLENNLEAASKSNSNSGNILKNSVERDTYADSSAVGNNNIPPLERTAKSDSAGENDTEVQPEKAVDLKDSSKTEVKPKSG